VSTIAVGKHCVQFKPKTPICGNCDFEQRTSVEGTNRMDRTCTKHLWFVLLSGSCKDHVYKKRGTQHGTSKS
jgi:hypothetical protein